MRSHTQVVRCVWVGSALIGMLLVGGGCAMSPPQAGQRVHGIVEPEGPGSVFPSISAAVVDGLAYAYRESEQQHLRKSRGGVVYRVEEGFSYRALVVAPRTTPDRVTIALGHQDVAHFATYPKGTPSEDRLNEEHSRHDRRNVDKLDPRHRPAFILTPSLKVRGYGGSHGDFVDTIVAEAREVAFSD